MCGKRGCTDETIMLVYDLFEVALLRSSLSLSKRRRIKCVSALLEQSCGVRTVVIARTCLGGHHVGLHGITSKASERQREAWDLVRCF